MTWPLTSGVVRWSKAEKRSTASWPTCTWSMWMVSTRTLHDQRRVLRHHVHHRLGGADHRRERVDGRAVDDARRRRAQVEPGDLVLERRAASRAARSRGTRARAARRSPPRAPSRSAAPARSRSRRSCRGSRRARPRPGRRCPAAAPARAAASSTRVIWVRPWSISFCCAGDLLARSASTCVAGRGRQRLEALVLLGDLDLLLVELRRLLGLQLAAGVELLLLRARSASAIAGSCLRARRARGGR